jgi:hypothetical protein
MGDIIDANQSLEAAKNSYTDAEKLELINRGLMDPAELGLTAPTDSGPDLKVLPDAAPEVKLGSVVNVRIAVVPIELRLAWAEQEEKVIGAFDREAWIEIHRDEFAIQGELACGNVKARFAQLFKDPVLGFAQLLRQAADRLEEAYTKGADVNADNKTDEIDKQNSGA